MQMWHACLHHEACVTGGALSSGVYTNLSPPNIGKPKQVLKRQRDQREVQPVDSHACGTYTFCCVCMHSIACMSYWYALGLSFESPQPWLHCLCRLCNLQP